MSTPTSACSNSGNKWLKLTADGTADGKMPALSTGQGYTPVSSPPCDPTLNTESVGSAPCQPSDYLSARAKRPSAVEALTSAAGGSQRDINSDKKTPLAGQD